MEINENLENLSARVRTLDSGTDLEFVTLEAERADLIQELYELALDLSPNGTDVSICLDIALEDVERISKNRGK